MLSDLAFALAAKGHAVQVITSRLTYEGNPSLLANENIGAVAVSRIPTTAFGRGNLLGRTLDYFTFYVSAAFRLALDAERGDVIVVKTDPPMLSVVAAPIAWLKGARTINWLQDFFPEVATALVVGRAKPQKWTISILRRLRDFTLWHAKANVVLGERMAQRLRKRRVPEERITIIANWADGTQNPPRGANPKRPSQSVEPQGRFCRRLFRQSRPRSQLRDIPCCRRSFGSLAKSEARSSHCRLCGG